ncbi:GNAT domain [Macleaya cordata]|uniref:GNAT domain n=1 Tax=Macleaya cordata TaxID=56857 RepID=A0A200R161_MACCD|nr:GNAT domain [Macleaya cordata]
MEEISAKAHGENQDDEKGKPKISIRPFELSDVDDFMVCGWETYTSKEDALNYMKDCIISDPWCKAICVKNRPIGTISVVPNRGKNRCRGEVSYVLASEHRGKGIATLAVKMVLDSIFKDWPHLERLEGLVDAENLGSQRVLEKAGFKKEGVLRKYYIYEGRTRDMVMYSFLSTDQKLG